MAAAETAIHDAIDAGSIPGAVLMVGRSSGVEWARAFGNRSVQPAPLPMELDTIFDLASLTKPLATAASIMLLAERGLIDVDASVQQYLPAFGANGKAAVTVAQLLLHLSGLPPFNSDADYDAGRERALEVIYQMGLDAPAGSAFVYSDLGHIVLGELVAAVSGRSLSAFAAAELFAPLRMLETGFCPAAELCARAAPTEQRDGRWLQGQVHDPRAAKMGGVAGHAGLFGSAADVSRFVRMLLRGGELDGVRVFAPATVERMLHPLALPGGVPGGTRCLLLDVDTSFSACRGDRFAAGRSAGHTGFTGTMLWLDADKSADAFVVLLTNAAHPAGPDRDALRRLRSAVATAAAETMLGPLPAKGAAEEE